LPLLGKGSVYYKGEELPTAEVLAKFNWQPIELKAKEGLALLNGTQFMSAYGVHSLLKAYKLSYFADFFAAISLEAFDGRLEPFNDFLQLIRPHN
jgi:histidine ammonia-lyase